jgi:hypothetical protein
MIDPSNVTDTSRAPAALEEFLLFCIVVAGKNADQQSAKLEGFLRGRSPFVFIRECAGNGSLGRRLREVRLGKYTLLGRSFRQLAESNVDLRSCPWETLTRFPGIGIKTAKFFVLHSRPGQMHGVLDTHVLSWMREHWAGAGKRALAVPRHSPQGDRLLRDGRRDAPRGTRGAGRGLGPLRPRPLEGAARGPRRLAALDQLDLVALRGVDERDHGA